MLKKVFSVMVLAAALILVGAQNQAEAHEVYMGNYSDGTAVYLITESLVGGRGGFDCRVRAGYDYLKYSFFQKNGRPYYTNSEGYEGYVYGGASPVAANIYSYVNGGR